MLGLLGAAVPFAAGAALAVGEEPAAADEGSHVPPGLRPGGEVDRLIRRLHSEGAFSGTVRVTRKGRTVLERSVGMADRATGTANTRGTRFCVGSVTKMFTAVALLRLVQEHRVDLSAPIGTYLDGFAADVARTVTPHHLLTHTSGLGDYMRVPGFFDEAPGWATVADAWEGGLSFVRRDPLAFPAGGRHVYSNSGFYVLGAIVAAVSGRSYYDYVAEHVFARAGMRRSGFFTKDVWRSDTTIARPYQDGADVLESAHFHIGSPAGSSFADAADLERFMNALYTDRLLNAPHTHLATSPKGRRPDLPPDPSKPRLDTFYSYAPALRLVADRDWAVGHGGGAPGVSANVERYPRGEWVAVTLSNAGDRATGPVDRLISDLITGS
ncbi:serine hydrolase [Phytomonospora endophytica]|nr:serine hydrolase [Phytomonospora endophytica]